MMKTLKARMTALLVGSVTLAAVAWAGTGALPAFAQSAPPAQVQTCADNQANDATESTSSSPDSDTVDLQCGDQSAPDQPGVNEASDIGEAKSQSDTDTLQQGSGSQVEDGKPDLPGSAAEDASGK